MTTSAIETLGYFAAVCDVESAYKNISDRERRELEARAEKYRKMQFKALEKI